MNLSRYEKVKSRMIKYLTFSLLIIISLNSFSQEEVRPDFKSSLVSEIGKFNFQNTLDLVWYYKTNQIEILTLELEKIGCRNRKIFAGKIYFGVTPFSYSKELGQFEIGDVIFEKEKSPYGVINENYYSMKIYVERKNLYKILIDINKSNFYDLYNQSMRSDGFYKRFEYKSNTENSKLIIETFDGDNRSYVVIRVN
jgi:hypothetical protein